MSKFKKLFSLLLCCVTVLTMFCTTAVTASAITQSAAYGNEAENSGDYAYWNGSKMVKSSSTSKDEVKWMQNTLNHCIKFEGLKATLLTVDGNFGPASQKATIAFQKAAKLTADGSFGPSTIKKMKSVLNDNKRNSLKSTAATTTNSNTSSTFKRKNILQVNAKSSNNYISGNWYSLTNGKGNYNSIKTAGCGIVSLVSAIYNLGGTIDKNKIGSAVDNVFDWAYKEGHWKYQSYWSLFTNSDDKFGNTYGFKVSKQYGSKGGKVSLNNLVKHMKNGGTAVVHVEGHFMTIAGHKTKNGKDYLLIYDPAPGQGSLYNSSKRKGITSASGSWISLSDLKNDGGTKGSKGSKENIEIDAYWLVSSK